MNVGRLGGRYKEDQEDTEDADRLRDAGSSGLKRYRHCSMITEILILSH